MLYELVLVLGEPVAYQMLGIDVKILDNLTVTLT